MSIASIFPISLWQALGISAVIYLTHAIIHALSRTNKSKTPPMADTRPFIPIPLLSHTLELVTNPSFITTQSLKHGPLLQFNTVLGPSIAIASASAIKFFHRLDGKCLDGCLPEHWIGLLGSHSVGVVSGDVHKRLRRTVLGLFTVKALKGYMAMVETTTAEFIDSLANMSNDTKGIALLEPAKEYTMQVALRIIFGPDAASSDSRLENMSADFIEWLGGLGAFIPYRIPGLALDRAHKARERIIANLKSFVEERKRVIACDNELGEDDSERKDVLENLLRARDEQGNPLTDDEVYDTLLTLIFAGHDTSTATICTSMVALSLIEGTEFYQKLVQEVRDVFGGELNKPIDFDTMTALPYLGAFFKEVLRWCTPIRAMQRRLTQDIEYDSFQLRAGQSITLTYSNVMTDPANFSNPDDFDPERFLPDRAEDKKCGGAYVPFGGGVRQCLGMGLAKLEIKVFLVHLLRGYEVSVESFERINLPVQFLKPCVSVRKCSE